MLRGRVSGLCRQFSAQMSEDKTVYQFTVKGFDGSDVCLDKYKGKVVLVVNVASQCGLTDSNYKWLKEVLDKYRGKGLEIAAFPCNQFKAQEPACELDIKNFVKSKYSFEPDLYAKIDVNGDAAIPFFKFLKKEQGAGSDISWNFGKFLISREGKVVARFEPKGPLDEVVQAIEKLL